LAFLLLVPVAMAGSVYMWKRGKGTN
jgi:hypothetical protein